MQQYCYLSARDWVHFSDLAGQPPPSPVIMLLPAPAIGHPRPGLVCWLPDGRPSLDCHAGGRPDISCLILLLPNSWPPLTVVSDIPRGTLIAFMLWRHMWHQSVIANWSSGNALGHYCFWHVFQWPLQDQIQNWTGCRWYNTFLVLFLFSKIHTIVVSLLTERRLA